MCFAYVKDIGYVFLTICVMKPEDGSKMKLTVSQNITVGQFSFDLHKIVLKKSGLRK